MDWKKLEKPMRKPDIFMLTVQKRILMRSN